MAVCGRHCVDCLNHTSHTSLKIQPKFKLLYFSFFYTLG
nr:MAG TPA: Histo-aspartic protease-aspartic protease, HAP, Plasmepsin, Aspartic [Bacteriophage sp.]